MGCGLFKMVLSVQIAMGCGLFEMVKYSHRFHCKSVMTNFLLINRLLLDLRHSMKVNLTVV